MFTLKRSQFLGMMTSEYRAHINPAKKNQLFKYCIHNRQHSKPTDSDRGYIYLNIHPNFLCMWSCNHHQIIYKLCFSFGWFGRNIPGRFVFAVCFMKVYPGHKDNFQFFFVSLSSYKSSLPCSRFSSPSIPHQQMAALICTTFLSWFEPITATVLFSGTGLYQINLWHAVQS